MPRQLIGGISGECEWGKVEYMSIFVLFFTRIKNDYNRDVKIYFLAIFKAG